MKPSKISVIKAKTTKLLLSGFRAITWMGTIYCKKQSDVDLINKTDKIDSILKCHETIHVRQAKSTNDSWIIFYAKYVWQWILNFPLIFIDTYYPYKFISFEIEAYCYENDFNYPNDTCDNWVLFNKLSLKEKKLFAREYKKSRKTFNQFINEVILPYINKKEA